MLGHAIAAPQVAAVGHRQADIVDPTTETVDKAAALLHGIPLGAALGGCNARALEFAHRDNHLDGDADGAIAALYSSVGHGGASGYLATMALFSVAAETMKPTVLGLVLVIAGSKLLLA